MDFVNEIFLQVYRTIVGLGAPGLCKFELKEGHIFLTNLEKFSISDIRHLDLPKKNHILAGK